MANTATSTLARLGNAVVLPYFPRRLPEGGYLITIDPPLENFPCGDPVEDTKQYHAVLEAAIRRGDFAREVAEAPTWELSPPPPRSRLAGVEPLPHWAVRG